MRMQRAAAFYSLPDPGALFTCYIASCSEKVTIFLSIPLFFGPASKSQSKSVTILDPHSM